ncbi:hypothetical protein [Niabella ginsengisoli]|uniref:Uncharacterized protein n=1 Tax=Niabella ginsengisoli TaxID=522298 RepID=A0ABS9SIP5_9BACT|nr:hypothetical protein [Niabella ginsengisoli]MCH5598252.1 hypothetical protein [Niabella ginsengisoli]
MYQTAVRLMEVLGTEVYINFNEFGSKVDEVLKGDTTKLAASEKKQILDTVSWYDEEADKVIKKIEKLNGQKLSDLLDYLGCAAKDLPYYGYFPSSTGSDQGKKANTSFTKQKPTCVTVKAFR